MKKLLTITFFLLKVHFLLLGQIYDSEGWTINTPKENSRIIYISSSGNDLTAEVYDKNSSKVGNDPFLPTENIKPFKTIVEAKKRLRVGFADWILFKKGDVFENQVFGAIQLKGENYSDFLLIGSYGTKNERPKLLTGNKTFLYLLENSNFIKIIGLNIEANNRTNAEKTYGIIGNELIYLNLIVEDCHFDKFSTHIYLKNSISKPYAKLLNQKYALLTNIRRNIFTNSYYQYGTYGLEFVKTNGTSIYQNYFENNGWDNLNLKKFNSNLYTGSIGIGVECFDMDVRENIISKSNGFGIKAFSSSTISNNLFLENYSHAHVFIHKKDEENYIKEDKENEQLVFFNNNIFLDLMLIDSQTSNSLVYLDYFKSNVYFSNNILLKSKKYKIIPSSLDIRNNYKCEIFKSIFYEYGNDFNAYSYNISSLFSKNSFFEISNSDIQNFNNNSTCINSNVNFNSKNNNFYNINDTNKWFNFYQFKFKIDSTSNYQEKNYPDPRRDINSLMNYIGLIGNSDSFFSIRRTFNKQNYNESLNAPFINNYFREGFALNSYQSLSIIPKNSENYIHIYPNPVNNELINIDTKYESLYQIFDFSGKLVLEGNLSEGKNHVKLNNIKNGMYFLKIDNNFQKIIISN